MCIFCTAGKVETEKHFILECEAFKDNMDGYANVFADKAWDDLFNEGTGKVGGTHHQVEQTKDGIAENNVRVGLSHRLFLAS